ncbi:MAG: hypothetical protein AAGD06_07405 [Acidobacteriota bacterium]
MHTDEGNLFGRDALRLATQRYRDRQHLSSVAQLAAQAMWGLQKARTPDVGALRLAAYLQALALWEGWEDPGTSKLKGALTALAKHFHSAPEESTEWTDWQHARGVCLGRLAEGDDDIHLARVALWDAVAGNVRHGRVQRALLCGLDLLVLAHRSGVWTSEAIKTAYRIQKELARYEGPEGTSDRLLTVAVLWGAQGLDRLLRVREQVLRRSPESAPSFYESGLP